MARDQQESLRILGRTIARKRDEHGLTQEKVVAQLTDNNVENYSKIERGLRNVQFACHPPGAPTLVTYVQARCSATHPESDVGHAVLFDATAGTQIELTVRCTSQ